MSNFITNKGFDEDGTPIGNCSECGCNGVDLTVHDCSNVYTENDYKNRKAYLESLCEEYDPEKVYALAELFGPEEDFDGLVTSLEDGF